MFIFSVKASTIKVFAVLILTFSVLLGFILSGETIFASGESVVVESVSADGSTAKESREIDLSGIKTEDDRVAFVEQFGVRVKGAACESESFVMPQNFDRVLLGYNEIQKKQGLDLSKYAKKKLTRYTYELEDYSGYDGTVYVNILVYKNRVVGCDISSADPSGFVRGLLDYSPSGT